MANINETESNDLRTNANTFTTNDTVYGKISALNDVDCFKIQLIGYGNVTFKLAIPSNVNYRMRIFKGSTSTTAVAEDISTTIGTQRSATFYAQNDWYYVVVSPQSNLYNANTNYTLTASPTLATAIQLTASPNSISIGSTSNITTKITPSNAYTSLTYSTTGSISFTDSYHVVGTAVGTGIAKLTDSISGKSGTVNITVTARTTIDIPSNRTCNWNQFYTTIVNTLGSTQGCAWTCGLDVANIYGRASGTAEYVPSDMSGSTYWSGGYRWVLPSTCKGSFASGDSYGSGYTDAQRFEKIRSEINNNRPVVIGLYKSNSTDEHFVVAYGYTGTGTSTSQIKVYDTARSKTDTTTKTGRDTTLDNAINWNEKTGMAKLRLTSGSR